ncbi:MAG: alpha-galactosidase [Clostridiales bacterium]|nr:alpha-galactosidase [Clostridiales bacterium]
MIKTDGGTFYLTAGEACYIFKTDGGELRHVHFGKRVEPEDDLIALGFGADSGAELGGIAFARDGGKPLAVKLEYLGAQVVTEKPAPDRPALTGGKTLIVDMRDVKSALRAKLYYTPYPRGGFSRRIEIYNDGSKPVTLMSPPQTVTLAREYDIISIGAKGEKRRVPVGKYTDDGNAMANFIAAAKPTASESHGDVYGFLCAYGDGAVHAATNGAATVINCDEGGRTTEIAAGSMYTLPEVLAVYSDGGVGGMSRIFHDVLRENMGDRTDGKRRPIALYCPSMPVDKTRAAASAASELGCDVFVVDCGDMNADELRATAEACKASGIKLGVRVNPNAMGKSSAVYIERNVKSKNGKFAVDMTDEGSVEAFIAVLSRIITEYDLEYIMIDIPRGGVAPFASNMWRVRSALAAKFSEIVTEWGAVTPEMLIGQ